MKLINQKFALSIFLTFFSLMYFYSILSPQHYGLGKLDAYISIFSLLLVCLGLMVFFIYKRIVYFSFSAYIWLYFIILITLQPYINHIVYVDSLLFPIAILIVNLLIAIAIANTSNLQRQFLINKFSWILVLTGCLLVFTQLLQLIAPEISKVWIMPLNGGNRLTGNIAQPNQAAFVITMAIAAVIYLYFLYKDKVEYKLTKLIGTSLLIGWLGLGISFSSSRASLILVSVTLLASSFYHWQSWLSILKIQVIILISLSIAYKLGGALMHHYLPSSPDAINRLVHENSLGIRLSLLKQAWLAFSHNPYVGIGYNNFNFFGILHAREINWSINADHAHNIIAEIAAEFGLLGIFGLIGFCFILFMNIKYIYYRKLPDFKIFTLSLLIIVSLYSLSEFPLWYARFLFLTAFLISILDGSFILKKNNFILSKFLKIFSLITLLVLSVGSVFYSLKYNEYLKAYEIVTSSNLPIKQRIAAYNQLPNTFGYTKYKESLLFILMPIEFAKIDQQIALGYRVVNAYGFNYIIEKQASLLAYDNRYSEAIKFYEALCKQEQTDNILTSIFGCPLTLKSIRQINAPNANQYINELKEKGY